MRSGNNIPRSYSDSTRIDEAPIKLNNYMALLQFTVPLSNCDIEEVWKEEVGDSGPRRYFLHWTKRFSWGKR